MIPYSIHITKAAERDVVNASDYIDNVLKNPTAADHLLNEFEASVESLASFPCKFPLAHDDLLASLGIRFIPVKNYLILYLVDENTHVVQIIRFLYRKSNWISVLKGGISID